MRLALWAPALAAAAAALPGSSESSIAVGSTATPTSSSTPEPTSTDVSSEFEEGSLKRVCQNKGDPAKDWVDFKMGQFLNDTSSQWCDDEELFPDGEYHMSWPRKFSSLLPQNEKWYCYASQGCDIPTNVTWCDDNQNAQVQFALYAVQNFHDWMKMLMDSIDQAAGHYSRIQTDLVETFKTNDVDNSNDLADGLAIGGAVMGVVGALAGAAGPAGGAISGLAGIAGAGLSLGGAIAATDTPNPAEVLQEELSTLGDMGKKFDACFRSARDYYKDYSARVVQTTPKEECGSYVDSLNSAPAVLNSGKYAAAIEYERENGVQDLAMVLTDTAAVGFVWKAEKVYIAKLTKPIDGMNPCDAYHEKFEELWGACDEETGALYLYVKWGYADKKSEWTAPPGIEEIADFRYDPDTRLDTETYHVDLLAMAKAAEMNQQTNGYNSSATASTMLETLKADEGGLENALSVNLPVCYLDNIIDHYFDKNYWRWKETVVKDALNLGCGSIPNNIKHWPYDYDGHANEPASYFNQNPERDDAKDSIVIDDRGYVTYPKVDVNDHWFVYWE